MALLLLAYSATLANNRPTLDPSWPADHFIDHSLRNTAATKTWSIGLHQNKINSSGVVLASTIMLEKRLGGITRPRNCEAVV